MITFQKNDARFNYRIVGIAIHENKVLLHKAENDDFWALPGGRAEFFESSEETLRREMKEEINVDVSINRLIWIVENFFVYDDQKFHELAMYYLMNFQQHSYVLKEKQSFYGNEEGVRLIFKWFDIDELGNITLYPSFLKGKLKSIPKEIEHIVYTE